MLSPLDQGPAPDTVTVLVVEDHFELTTLILKPVLVKLLCAHAYKDHRGHLSKWDGPGGGGLREEQVLLVASRKVRLLS